MRTLKYNGEFWYEDRTPLLVRIATWCVWVGGWKTFRTWPLRERLSLEKLTPISVLGHRATFFGHWFDVQLPSGTLVVNLREKYAYISRNGTPSQAHTWLYGAPREIERAAAMRSANADDRQYS